VSMQRHCTHCMHKVHRSYKYTVQRRDEVVVVVEGDSCVKKEESAAAEMHRRQNGALNGDGTQSIKGEEQKVQGCVQEDSEADRAAKSCRTVMSLVSHC
jgi:hypothetical protein